MSKLYEGLFIFSESMDDEALDKSIESVKVELNKLGGSVKSSAKIGKKYFSRSLKKKKSGHYVVIIFDIDGSNMDSFKERLKLGTDVFRYQFTVTNEKKSLVKED